jgi:hypothetical protein
VLPHFLCGHVRQRAVLVERIVLQLLPDPADRNLGVVGKRLQKI